MRRSATDDGFVATFGYRSGSGRRTRQLTVSVPLAGRRVRLSEEHSDFRWISAAEVAGTNVTGETRRVLEQWFDGHQAGARA